MQAHDQEGPLTFGVLGSAAGSNYYRVMRHQVVQRLLLDIAEALRPRDFLDAALSGSGVDRENLEELGLVRRRDGAYVISFALFTKADVHEICAVAERTAVSLVRSLLVRRGEIDSALARYDLAGVDPTAVAYVVLGCFSLDWDGLELTAEKGYRVTPASRAEGRNFIPWAGERGGTSLKGIYWGSHTDGDDLVRFTSFGDHFSVPRRALPDSLWRLPGDAARDLPEPLRGKAKRVVRGALKEAMRQAGRMMFALRDQERTAAELAAAAGTDTETAKHLLDLPAETGYAQQQGERYRARIPVLTERDASLVQALRRIGWEVMEAWLSANYDSIRSELSDVTPVRYGVPCPEVFSQI